jgi:hypothetical protein
MTTGPYQQSDYKTNIDQTDRRLHVTAGGEPLKTEEQNLDASRSMGLLADILEEIKLSNEYLKIIAGEPIL